MPQKTTIKIEKELLKNTEYLKQKEDIKKAINFLKNNFNEEKSQYNLEIANILAQSKLTYETVCSGILYKTHEYKKKIEQDFSKEILNMILEQKKIKEIKSRTKFSKNNPLRQIILTTIKDPRVIFVKLAAKLTNLKRIKKIPEEKREKIAKESLDLYAALAERLGLEKIRREIVDISFKILNPKKYEEIQKFLKDSKKQREKFIEKTIKKFENLLKNKVKLQQIKGRDKQIHSIYEKIINKKTPLDKQRDHFAIRIILNTQKDCYTVLEEITKKYQIVPNSFKDYIKEPKKNGYQSLHVTLLVENKKMLEVQIRTKEMDEIAEEGKAAHYAYKGMKTDISFEKKITWLKEILNLKNESFKDLKLNMFEKEIYCYSPKGDAFKLPKNATVLDFAYAIHAEIGNKAIAGLVNKKFLPLKTKIKNGDIIEIITNKFQRPRRSWMKFVTTEKARKYIQRNVKKYEKIPVSKTYLTEDEEKNKLDTPIEIIGLKNHKALFAKCCNPLPSQNIVGIAKSHKIVLVHKEDCDKIQEIKKKPLLVEWKNFYVKPIKIHVSSKDRAGILADLLNTIIRQKIKVTEANAKTIENDQTQCSFTINPENVNELKEIIKRLYKIEGVKNIWLN